MTTPTQSQIERARRICAEMCTPTDIGRKVAAEFLAGEGDDSFDMKIALTAIIETQEWAARVADDLGGVRGLHDAVSPSNRAQHVRARTIAAAIRAG